VYLTSAGRLVAFLACAFAYITRLNKTATRALSNVQRGRTREWDSRTFEMHYSIHCGRRGGITIFAWSNAQLLYYFTTILCGFSL